jgi:hypothetical protein
MGAENSKEVVTDGLSEMSYEWGSSSDEDGGWEPNTTATDAKKCGGKPDWQVTPSDPQLAVNTAARNGDEEELRPLLGQGLSPNGLWFNAGGQNALHEAVIGGHAGVTRMLIEAGADIQAKTKYHPVSFFTCCPSVGGAGVRPCARSLRSMAGARHSRHSQPRAVHGLCGIG